MYWWVAAHYFPPAQVGFAAAAISGIGLIGTLSVLGQSTMLIAELPRRPGSEGSLIATALLLAGGVGAALGAIFAVLARYASADLAPLGTSVWAVLLFAAGVSLTAMAVVLDGALIGLLRGWLQLWRNGIFAAAKLAVIAAAGVWLSRYGGIAIVLSWVLGIVASVAGLSRLMAIGRASLRRSRPRLALMPQLGRDGLRHHSLNLALQGPGLALPLIVTTLLSATATAYFYTAWMIVGFVFVSQGALGTALYAVGTREPEALARRVRLTLSLAVAIGAVAIVALFLIGNQMLSIFGHSYAQEARATELILALAVFPLTVRTHYVAICRIAGRVATAAALAGVTGVIELVLAGAGGALGGLTGLSIGWLAATCVGAVLMAGPVLRVLRGRPIQGDQVHTSPASVEVGRY